MKIHLLPMEPFEERYTGQWLKWWPHDLRKAGIEVNEIRGRMGEGERDCGEFADTFKTWQWKGSQIEALATAFRDGVIADGDVLLSLEGWGSPTTAAAYLRDVTGRRVRLAIYIHAGTYDPWDYLRRLEPWARNIECGWFKAADLILAGSEYHRQLLIESRGVAEEKIFVCGIPIKKNEYPTTSAMWKAKLQAVVFPHRLSASKAPWEFDNIQRIFEARYGRAVDGREVLWIKTRDPSIAGTDYDGYTDKFSYYRLLARSRVVVSTARQETFGIAMQEGIALGAWAVAPNRLSYPEVIRKDTGFLYSDLGEAADLVYDALRTDKSPEWDGYHELAIDRAAEEIKGRFKEA